MQNAPGQKMWISSIEMLCKTMLQIDFSKLSNIKVQIPTTSRMGQRFAGKFIIERPQLEGDR